MYSLAIVFGPSAGQWGFMFKDKARADHAYASVIDAEENPLVVVVDDFGQRAAIRKTEIHAVLLEDMSETAKSSIERSLHQARMQATANRQAQNDPVLKTAAMMSGQMPNGPMLRQM